MRRATVSVAFVSDLMADLPGLRAVKRGWHQLRVNEYRYTTSPAGRWPSPRNGVAVKLTTLALGKRSNTRIQLEATLW